MGWGTKLIGHGHYKLSGSLILWHQLGIQRFDSILTPNTASWHYITSRGSKGSVPQHCPHFKHLPRLLALPCNLPTNFWVPTPHPLSSSIILEQFMELRKRFTYCESLLQRVPVSSQIHRAQIHKRTQGKPGRIPNAEACVLVELGCTSLRTQVCSPTWKIPELHRLGFLKVLLPRF